MRQRFIVTVTVLLALAATGCDFSPEGAKRRYVETGNKYFKNGKYKEASIMYRRAIQKDLKFGEAYYRLALAEMQLQRYQEAVRALRRSMELDPKNTDAHARLADFYLLIYAADRRRPQNLLAEVRDIADSLLKADPNSFHGFRIRGLELMLEKKEKEAIEAFRSAEKAQPLTRDVVLPLAQLLISGGQTAEGENLAKAFIQKDKEYGPVYDLLYADYARTNRLAEAEALLNQKVAANPREASYLLQLAGHYFVRRQRAEMAKTLERITGNPKDFPLGHAMVGDFYFRLNEFDQAIQLYQQGEQASPKDRALYLKKTAEALIYDNKKTEAAQVLDTVLKANSGDNEALSMRASLRLQTGSRDQVEAAINELQSVIRRMPENPVLRYEIGRAHVAKGDAEQGRLQFQEAVRLRPDYVPPRLTLAQLDLSKGDFGSAIQRASEVLSIDPNNTSAKLIRSSAMIGMGDRSKAREELQRTLQSQPESRDAQFQVGMLNFTEKNYKGAEEVFRKLQQMNPPDPRGLLGLVEILVAQGQFDSALKLLNEEIRKNPDRVELRLYLANTAVRGGKYTVAIDNFKAILEKNPKRDDILVRLGETYRRAGDPRAAVENFQRAAELNPSDPIPVLQIALLHEASGRRQEARPLYERTLKLQPDNPVALNNLAYMLAESGADLDQALTYAQRAKQQLPQDPNVADTLGWIYIKKNLSDNAIQIFQELVNKNPAHPTFRYHLAMALFQKGDKPRARRELETALKNKPTKEDEAKIKDLMARIG